MQLRTSRLGNKKHKLAVETFVGKNQAHPGFPSGPPPQYYLGPTRLNCSDRTGRGVERVVWRLAKARRPVVRWKTEKCIPPAHMPRRSRERARARGYTSSDGEMEFVTGKRRSGTVHLNSGLTPAIHRAVEMVVPSRVRTPKYWIPPCRSTSQPLAAARDSNR